ncbi:GNAT family N-acetyltransferase [Companilactobacillus sp. HBUAS56257]|uniref:GNAT family N-acetyltransferase n=1 Tax=Companilactobacillus sp. HBUAS56257 TaxID=3109360 RepID=UPI002FEFBBAF
MARLYTQQPQSTIEALDNSVVLWAINGKNLIGLCRGITDNQTILYIQDILVDPAYQGQKIGTNLVNRFLKSYQNIGQTVLITDPEEKTLNFYKSLHFLEVTPAEYGRAFVMDCRFN